MYDHFYGLIESSALGDMGHSSSGVQPKEDELQQEWLGGLQEAGTPLIWPHSPLLALKAGWREWMRITSVAAWFPTTALACAPAWATHMFKPCSLHHALLHGARDAMNVKRAWPWDAGFYTVGALSWFQPPPVAQPPQPVTPLHMDGLRGPTCLTEAQLPSRVSWWRLEWMVRIRGKREMEMQLGLLMMMLAETVRWRQPKLSVYVQPMEPMPINSLNGPLLPSTEARDQCGETGTYTLKGKESAQTRLSGLLLQQLGILPLPGWMATATEQRGSPSSQLQP